MTQETSQQAESSSVRVNFSEADHLFLDDLNDVGDIITNDAEVTKLIYVINKIKSEIESLKETKRQHKEFYDRKINAADEQIDFLQRRIENYLHTKGQDKLPTPNGTAFFTTRKKYHYPDSNTLLQFAKDHDLEYKITEKPYKSVIKEFVEQGGQPPEGFSITEETSLQIRGNND